MTVAAPNTTPNATSTPPAASGTGLSNTSNMLNGNDFMTLLVAQLKNQDPTQPMDPTQFVTQLVQFNSLEQLIGIKQELAPAAAAAPTQP